MTDLRPTLSVPASGAHATPPGVRPLTADELGHLDRARDYLRASGADLTDLDAVGALLHATRTRWAAEPDAPVPQAMVMALGVGVGDLVVARVPGSRWALRTAGAAPTPAVVSLSGEDAALPLADVATRWRTGCTPTWVAEYVAAAAAHLTSPAAHDVPTPRVPTRTAPDVSRRRADAAARPVHVRRPADPRAGAGLPAAAEPAPMPSRSAAATGPEGYVASAPPDRARRRPGAWPPELGSGPAGPHVARVRVLQGPVAAAPPPPPAPEPEAAAYRVPADLPHPPSRAAQDIALGVLEQALEIALAPESSLAPFAVVDGSPTQSVEPRRFEGDPARALQEARAWVRSTGAARAAVVWFGRFSAQDGDAVFVEASDAGAPSLVVAHLYRTVTLLRGPDATRPTRRRTRWSWARACPCSDLVGTWG